MRAGMMKGKAQPATKAVHSKCQNSSLPSSISVRMKTSFATISDWPTMTSCRRSTRSVIAPPTIEAKIMGTATTKLMYASDVAVPVRSQASSVRVSICPFMAMKKAALPKNNQRNWEIEKTAKAPEACLLASADWPLASDGSLGEEEEEFMREPRLKKKRRVYRLARPFTSGAPRVSALAPNSGRSSTQATLCWPETQ